MLLYGGVIGTHHRDVVKTVKVIIGQCSIEQILNGTSLNGRNGQYTGGEDGYLHLSWAV